MNDNLPVAAQYNNKLDGNYTNGVTAEVTQEHNKIGRDNAGRDIINSVLNLPESKTPLRRMAEKYVCEIEKDENFQEFIEELQNYMQRVPGELRNLEKKLSDAGRNDLLPDAINLKENFAKKLCKHTFSPIAQKIFTHILAMINTCFIINPLIKEGNTAKIIDKAIYKEITEKIYNDIGDSKLSITMDDIRGMLYYLTGNCYIEWDK